MEKIAIIGCGWLGLPLAVQLIKNGYHVNGSTTQADKLSSLEQKQIVPYLIQIQNGVLKGDLTNFLSADLLIINIPPGRDPKKSEAYLDNLNILREHLLKSPIQNIIFISSTSVYANNQSIHTELSCNFSDEKSAVRMKAAEDLFFKIDNKNTTVVRMAGLIGPNRHPGRFFAGKTDIPNGLTPVNLIHLDDCIGVIEHIISNNLWNQYINACAPSHPKKHEFYNLASLKLYQQNAFFVKEEGDFKIINADKITSLGYTFKYPDLMEWLKTTPN